MRGVATGRRRRPHARRTSQRFDRGMTEHVVCKLCGAYNAVKGGFMGEGSASLRKPARKRSRPEKVGVRKHRRDQL
jgi:hypothetical protein